MRAHPGGGNSGSGERVEESAEEEEDALRGGQGADAEDGVTGAAAPGAATGNEQETGARAAEDVPAAQSEGAGVETAGVYEFPDTKTSGTVTVVKKWDDQSTNAERPAVDMVNLNLSTQKPSRNPLGYTVTFHADAEKGLTFADGASENEVVYNGNGQVVRGIYKGPSGGNGVIRWYTDRTYKEQIVLDENGQITGTLTGDVDVWPKEVTFEVKGENSQAKNEFHDAIPDTITTVIFTDEVMPAEVALIDVDADGDGGVVAWTEEDGTVMKVSSQAKGVEVQAAKNSGGMFYSKSRIQTIDFTNLDTANVTNMVNMFCGCSGLTSLDVSAWDTGNVTNMVNMFYGCRGLTNLDVSAWTTGNVTTMSRMFSGCSGLTNLDVSSFDTAKVTDMSYMFYECNSLLSLDVSTWDTGNVTDMGCMFFHCCQIQSLDMLMWDTSKVRSMRLMFCKCSSLKNLNLSSFDTNNVISMNGEKDTASDDCGMFSECISLQSLNLTSFSTSKITNFRYMFSRCKKISNLQISNFDTSNATDMEGMFTGIGLISLDLSSFDTTKVTNMKYMFSSCSKLTSLDLSVLNTANVTDMGYMFSHCSGLTNLDLTPLDTTKVTNMSCMFYGCSGLTSLDLSSFDTAKVTNMNAMFYDCDALTTLTTGVNFRFVGTNYALPGTWRNTAGETFTRGTFPSNVADTYTKIAS